MVISCVRLTDVSVIDTIRRYENRKTIWGWASCAQRRAQGNDFDLIFTVKMETRPFGSEFSASVIIAVL